MKKAYGGVVINPSGEVLLREPAGHSKGDVWTFAKGKPEWGEAPEQTALREVLEETGYRAEIVARIPGSFDGKNTSNEYFLMAPVEDINHFDAETQAVRWATVKEARQLIQLNQRPSRRRRDLRVLKLALALFRSLEPILPHGDPAQADLQAQGCARKRPFKGSRDH
jgi:ADP-ribose pyrophosphatase YjhB (NUDIX family)